VQVKQLISPQETQFGAEKRYPDRQELQTVAEAQLKQPTGQDWQNALLISVLL
jgi:hypothetical protein